MAIQHQDLAAKKKREICEIISAIRHIKGVNQTQARELMKRYHITGEQLGALRIVASSHEMTLGELSGQLYLHVSTCSGIVDRLEKKNYINRERSKEDRRVVYLRITPLGTEIVKKTPVSGIGRLMRDIEQLSSSDIRKIRDAVLILSQVMDIESTEAQKIAE